LLRGEIIDRKGNIPELEVFGINVAKEVGIFLLDQVFQEADVFALRNLHSKHLIFRITDNEAVE
jgi:hypothetical protein